MMATHLVFALATTTYILIAIRWEERDLIDAHGPACETYRAQVPMLVPNLQPYTAGNRGARALEVA